MLSNTTTIDPFHQNITFYTSANMSTTQTITIDDINAWYYYRVRIVMNYMFQMGASIIMAAVTAIFTKSSKRRMPVFWLNEMSLVFSALRVLFASLFYDSRESSFYIWFSRDASSITTKNYAIDFLGPLISFLMVITIQLSLALQARAVAREFSHKWLYFSLFSVSCLIVFLTLFTKLCFFIMNVLGEFQKSNWIYNQGLWLQTASLAMETISIWWFCGIFSAKLGWGMHARKQLHLPKWRPTDILLAVAACTMVVPSGFAILEWAARDPFPQAQTWGLTSVALLLPFSSLWASMKVDQQASLRKQLWMDSVSGPDRGLDLPSNVSNHNWGRSRTTTRDGQFNMGRQKSQSVLLPVRTAGYASQADRRDSTDLELANMGVKVDKTYSVHSDRASDREDFECTVVPLDHIA